MLLWIQEKAYALNKLLDRDPFIIMDDHEYFQNHKLLSDHSYINYTECHNNYPQEVFYSFLLENSFVYVIEHFVLIGVSLVLRDCAYTCNWC